MWPGELVNPAHRVFKIIVFLNHLTGEAPQAKSLAPR